MSKELEAFERIKNITYDRTDLYGIEEYRKSLDIIESALKEKENIESRIDEIFSNHNIKSFVELNERLCDYNELKFDDDIKQMKLKAFDIIKEKKVDVGALYELDLELYNQYAKEINGTPTLTKEEYDLLKEVFL